MATTERLISVKCPVTAGKCLTRVAVFEVERETRQSRLGAHEPAEIQRLTSAALHVCVWIWPCNFMCLLCTSPFGT